MADLNDLLTASRKYGSDPKWVVAGGGNTSLKNGETLLVKASGFPLATIEAEGFARMDRNKLAAIWESDYPTGDDTESVADRERLVLADMMAARKPGEERRPSVETLLHDLLPWPLVVHLHPTLVNGLTCGIKGPEIAEELFGDRQCWIPVTDPGYVLALVIKDALKERTARGLKSPEYIFLANHGVFVGGESLTDVDDKYSRLHEALETRITRKPGDMPQTLELPAGIYGLASAVESFFGDQSAITAMAGGELARYQESRAAAATLTGCLTPDHIVYAGPGALYLDCRNISKEELTSHWQESAAEYNSIWGKPPNVTIIHSLEGKSFTLVAAGNIKSLANAMLLLENALEVSAYTESFGGALILEERFVRFIVDWEVENYRSKMASD